MKGVAAGLQVERFDIGVGDRVTEAGEGCRRPHRRARNADGPAARQEEQHRRAGSLEPGHHVGLFDHHRIGALVGELNDEVAGVVDTVVVVAGAAFQRIRAATAIEKIVSGIADDAVGDRVAERDLAGEQKQVLHVGRQVERHRAAHAHRIVAFTGGFHRRRKLGVKQVQVVAGAAVAGAQVQVVAEHPQVQRIGAAGAVQAVALAAAAKQDIGRIVAGDHLETGGAAGAVDGGIADQHQALDIGRQGQADAAANGVENRRVGRTCRLDHHVARLVDDIGVVAVAAAHGVGAGAAVDQVGATVAGNGVAQRVADAGAGAGSQHQGLDADADAHAGGAGDHRVVAAIGHVFGDIVGVVDHVGVVAEPAEHRVGAGAAIEQVVAAVADQAIGERVAGCIPIGAAGQCQGLEMVGEGGGERRTHLIESAIRGFLQDVARIIDQVHVVAGAAGHGVGAGTAVKQIAQRIAGDAVVAGIAVAAQRGAGQHQILKCRAEVVGVERRHHGVDAAAIDQQILRVVDHVGVVAGTAGERVDAGAAIERVIAAVAGERIGAAVAGDAVVLCVAGAGHIGAAGQGQVLEVGGKRRGERRADFVTAGIGAFERDIAGVVDHVNIVAQAASQGVGAAAAIENIGALVAVDAIVRRVAGAVDVAAAGERQIFQADAQRIRDRAVDTVDAGAGFDDAVAGVVDHVEVVAAAAGEGVGAAAAIEGVVAAAAGDRVAGGVADDVVGAAVAAAGNAGHAIEKQVLEPAAERKRNQAVHHIDAGAAGTGALVDDVAGRVDVIDVVAGAASHRVVAGAAIDGVVAGVAVDAVVAAVGEDRRADARLVVDRVVTTEQVVRQAQGVAGGHVRGNRQRAVVEPADDVVSGRAVDQRDAGDRAAGHRISRVGKAETAVVLRQRAADGADRQQRRSGGIDHLAREGADAHRVCDRN